MLMTRAKYIIAAGALAVAVGAGLSFWKDSAPRA
jgi:hypothetical protein